MSEYGGIWLQTSAPIGDWYSIASDSTGKYLAAVQYQGYIYTSTSSGMFVVINNILNINE